MMLDEEMPGASSKKVNPMQRDNQTINMSQKDRYTDLRSIAEELDLDAIALVPGANLRRLYNHNFHQNERPLVVIVPREGAPAAIVPNLELASFALLGFEGAVFDWRDETGYRQAFEALAEHMPLRRLGVEGQAMRVFVHHAFANVYPALEIIDTHMPISALRLCKNAHEITSLRKAIEISETALERTLQDVRIGQSEAEVEMILSSNLFECGAQNFAFTPIVAAAENSALPHASARADYYLKSGDALLLDFGAEYDGLCADITRTVFIGECSDKDRAFYETVLAANEAGIAATRPGVTAHEIDDIVIGTLEASPYRDFIRTKTGHGLGRDVHEAPYIMRGNHQVLEPGMVFTIEPGLYHEGAFGVRIEDDVLVTEDGVESLTRFEKTLTCIG